MAEQRTKTVVTVVSRVAPRKGPGRACLVVIYGVEIGRRFILEPGAVGIGRSSKKDIQIDQESVSRSHARLVVGPESVVVRDLGSTNGTYVNDQLVDEYVLRDGDLLKIGRTIFKFLSGDNIENAYHEEIYRLTTIDGLTQIFNRRYMLEQLEREMSRARRYQRNLSLMMFDIDHFKRINDTMGHLAGDAALKQLATLVQSRIRREDIFARYGGEEFGVILPEIDPAGALVFGEKVRALVAATPFRFEDRRIEVTISGGVATMVEGEDSDGLVKRADECLYAAKSGGRNRIAS
jgi:diguanylate cyclase (GGDEF)-like protein